MKANELRVGNLVDSYYICEVVTIHAGGGLRVRQLGFSGAADDTGIRKVRPIPLTEEWLLRFGAELIESGYDEGDVCIYKYSRFRLIWKASYNYWYVTESTSEEYLTKIEFVHEWQNFVFAMNGEELTLNK